MNYKCLPLDLALFLRSLISLLRRRRSLLQTPQSNHTSPPRITTQQLQTTTYQRIPAAAWNRLLSYPMTLSLLPLVEIWTRLSRISSVLDLSWFSRRTGSSLAGLGGGASGDKPADGSLPKPQHRPPLPDSTIQRLLDHPTLFDPIRTPRNPIVLCHGLYGFDVWGPSQFPTLQRHYWSDVLDVLRRKVGAEVVVTAVPSTGSIEDRAKTLHGYLKEKAKGRTVNFLAHSMGGLDCRHLITHLKPTSYTPASLTTISTPHRGSPFMDWCLANIGIGSLRGSIAGSPRNVPYSLKSPLLTRASPPPPTTPSLSGHNSDITSQADPSDPLKPQASAQMTIPLLNHLLSLPKSLTTLILSLIDEPAYANLTTGYMRNYFNPNTPNVPGVRYYSVAGRAHDISLFHPLWLPKVILDKAEEFERESLEKVFSEPSPKGWEASAKGLVPASSELMSRPEHEWGNDGLVSISSAKWGEFLGTVDNCDHWEIRGASGFANSLQAVGEAGGLGWVKGVDWSNWGAGWWGNDASIPPSSPKNNRTLADPEQKEKGAMSATMSWVGEQVSSDSKGVVSPQPVASETAGGVGQVQPRGGAESSVKPLDMPASPGRKAKLDLERFYVALSRKLYEDGL